MPGSILENIHDPPIPAPKTHFEQAPTLQPRHDIVRPKNGPSPVPVTLYPITQGAASLPSSLVRFLHKEFAAEIERGCTYPMEEPMALERFAEYWFGTFAVVVLTGSSQQIDGERNWEEECLGTFYVKPNYPGRCSHVCNAGFLTCTAARGKGVGMLMGKAYLEYAPKLGYKYSVFNLVFANNTASIRIWDKLGFTVLGRVPGAARLANSDQLVDALIYGRKLGDEEDKDSNENENENENSK